MAKCKGCASSGGTLQSHLVPYSRNPSPQMSNQQNADCTSCGAAFIYRSSDNGFTWPSNATQMLTASDKTNYASLGAKVALSGDIALLGLPSESEREAAYLFQSPDGGITWPSQETQILTASDETLGDTFGASIAVSGNTALIGAARRSVNGLNSCGWNSLPLQGQRLWSHLV
jgi:hypothetical protein